MSTDRLAFIKQFKEDYEVLELSEEVIRIRKDDLENIDKLDDELIPDFEQVLDCSRDAFVVGVFPDSTSSIIITVEKLEAFGP